MAGADGVATIGFAAFVVDTRTPLVFVGAFVEVLEAVLAESAGREVVATDCGKAGGETVTMVWLVATPISICINRARLKIKAWKWLGRELKNSITKVYCKGRQMRD